MRNGAEIAPVEPAAERDDYGQVLLAHRLRGALARLNRRLPAEALEDVVWKLTRPDDPDLIAHNRAVLRPLAAGVMVDSRTVDEETGVSKVRVLGFDHVDGNVWLAVSQFSLMQRWRRLLYLL